MAKYREVHGREPNPDLSGPAGMTTFLYGDAFPQMAITSVNQSCCNIIEHVH
jgi:hypothetical protein